MTATKIIFFINKTNILQDCNGNVIYRRIVCVYREGKMDKYCTQITMGSNLINYPGNG
jgi:hypothetical protein